MSKYWKFHEHKVALDFMLMQKLSLVPVIAKN